jgi:dCTP diphosphatase
MSAHFFFLTFFLTLGASMDQVHDQYISIADCKKRASTFVEERKWQKYHAPKNLSICISVEAGELLEWFTWLTPEESFEILKTDKADAIRDELADVFLSLLTFCNTTGIDLATVFEKKIKKIEATYPTVHALQDSSAIVDDNDTTLDTFKKRAHRLITSRGWKKHHTPKNLAMYIFMEAAELMEQFYTHTLEESYAVFKTDKSVAIEDEVADIFLCILNFCNTAEIDLASSFEAKMKKIEAKYPAEQVSGKNSKYTEY